MPLCVLGSSLWRVFHEKTILLVAIGYLLLLTPGLFSGEVRETKTHLMNRPALFLILVSQLLFLISSLIEPPSSVLMVILRVGVPLLIVAYIGLLLAGFISPEEK